MRGSRKCETCHWFQDRREQWAAGCKLDVCECRAKDRTFGIALCPNYKTQTFIDTSGLRLSGSAAGSCHWLPPPLLMPWPYRPQIVALTDWCSLYEPSEPTRELDDLHRLNGPKQIALTPHEGSGP